MKFNPKKSKKNETNVKIHTNIHSDNPALIDNANRKSMNKSHYEKLVTSYKKFNEID